MDAAKTAVETPAPRVLVIDDHAGFRDAVRRLLESDGLQVVGEAADAAAGIRAAVDLQPDLILLDVGLPDADGIEVAGRLAGVTRATVVLISSRDPATFAARLETSTSAGFIAKDELWRGRLRTLLEARRG